MFTSLFGFGWRVLTAGVWYGCGGADGCNKFEDSGCCAWQSVEDAIVGGAGVT